MHIYFQQLEGQQFALEFPAMWLCRCAAFLSCTMYRSQIGGSVLERHGNEVDFLGVFAEIGLS
jgi:hypothetical protein